MSTTARTLSCAAALVCVLHASVYASGTDVVQVANGDKFTGDVVRLERRELEFSTPSAGTIAIRWEDVVSLTSTRTFDVELISGERFTGTISSPSAGKLVVQSATGPSRPLDLKDIVRIRRIEPKFRERLTGSIDFGLSFTQADATTTYNLEGEAEHRTRSYLTDVSFDSWLSSRDNASTLARNELSVNVRRLLRERWFAVGTFQVQQDDPLELRARIIAGGGVGRQLVQTQRALVAAEGGLNYDGERYTGTDTIDNLAELFAGVKADWFARGATTASTTALTHIGLSRGRIRLDLDADVRRDFFWNLYWSVEVIERADSDPPGGRPKNDFGLTLALGWSF
jgi:hypothetical protein